MKAKIISVIFIFAFTLMLLIPTTFVDFNGGGVSEKENRMLASRPYLSKLGLSPSEFVRKFDDWFSDNVGFREYLIDCYKNTWTKLENNVQYTDGQYVMLIGEQGHHYFAYTDGWMISKFQGKPFVSEEQLQGLVNGLNQAKHYLDERGIPLIVMFCVDKETIYPEFYPKSIKRGPEPIQLDIITDYVTAHTDVDLFTIKDCLFSAKKEFPVFDKVGDVSILSHYNEIGAFFAYQELMKHINVYMPEIEAFLIEDIIITYADRGLYQNIPDVRLKQDVTYKLLEADFFDDVPLGNPSQGIAFENKDCSLPTILLLRDSYAGGGTFLSRYIPEHFGKTILIHRANMEHLKNYIERFQPDIVLFESAERELSGFANCAASLQKFE